MFVQFVIFCISVVMTALAMRVGLIRPCHAPIFGALAGGLTGLAYDGAVICAAAAGLLGAALWRLFCKEDVRGRL